MIIDANTLVAVGGVVTALGGVWASIVKISSHFRRKRLAYREAIVDQAKAEMELVKQVLEAKITKIEVELESQKQSVSKDLIHIKENYTNEIKSLAEQIQNLRQDLTVQHAGLVQLLTRLVDSR